MKAPPSPEAGVKLTGVTPPVDVLTRSIPVRLVSATARVVPSGERSMPSRLPPTVNGVRKLPVCVLYRSMSPPLVLMYRIR